MKLGYMAVGNRGTTYHLTDGNKHPRKQLLEKCYRQHAQKIFNDSESGESKHVGYIVGGEWFNIFEVHSWNNESCKS